MTVLFIIILIISLLYLLLIGYLYKGVLKTPVFNYEKNQQKNRFSILIVFRNESENMPDLLDSIIQIDYPKEAFEVLLINDFSTDNSVMIVAQYIQQNPKINLRLLHNQNDEGSPKKNAIDLAVKNASFEWILTTDADCILPKTILQTYDAYLDQSKVLFIAGAVSYIEGKNSLEWFQYFNWISLTGSTIGSFFHQKPLMCSGANLCYSKSAFQEIKPYENYQNFAGGDDVFLMQQFIKKYPDKVNYLLSRAALVYTKPVTTWRDFLQQQLRWAKKTSSSDNLHIKGMGLVVFLMNMAFIISIVGFFYSEYFLLFILLKIFIDTMLVSKTLQKFAKPMPIFYWLLSSFCYPFINIIIVFSSFGKNFNWKGRKFKK